MEEPQTSKISKIFRERLEKCLGKETSDLIFKTMDLVYKLDEETLSKNPDLFEQKIRRMLGDSTADIILKEMFKDQR
jgi:hypothetical protein